MPQTLSENATYDAGIVIPLGSEPRTIGSLTPGFGSLANRTKYLKTVLDTGVTKIRSYGNIASLRAAAIPGDGEHATIAGYGLYQYVSSSTASDDGILVVKPAAAGSTGRWWSAVRLLAGASGGVAGLDSGGHVPIAQLPTNSALGVPQLDTAAKVPVLHQANAFVGIYYQDIPSTSGLNNGDVVPGSLSMSLRAGDLVAIDASIYITAAATDLFGFRMRSNGSSIAQSTVHVSSSYGMCHFSGVFFGPGSDGTYAFDFQRADLASGTSGVVGASGAEKHSFIRALVCRP